MSALPRGTCPVCGRDVALRKGNLAREHRGIAGVAEWCRGSGMVAVGDQMIKVTATVMIAVAEDHADAPEAALRLVGDAIGPHVHGRSDWGGRFAIVTKFDMTAERVIDR